MANSKSTTRAKSEGLTRPKLAHTISHRSDDDELVSVGAVAANDDWLFVGRHSNSAPEPIEVYDTTTWCLDRQLNISGIGNWIAGLAISTTNHLFVSDADHAAIHKVDMTSDTSVLRWTVSGIPVGLSLVAQSGNVLVTCAGVERVREYTPDGKLVRDVVVDSSGCIVQHAVQRPTGELVVSAFQTNCIIELTPTDSGKARRYGTGQGSGVGQINCPRDLACDSHGCVLIADSGNRRIMVLDPSMTEARRLLPLPVGCLGDDAGKPDDGMGDDEEEDEDYEDEEISTTFYPTSICLVESRGRLYVGEDGDRCRVLIFENIKELISLFPDVVVENTSL